MRGLTRFGSAVAAVLMFAAGVVATVASPASAAATTICKSQPVPTGYVIIREGISGSCPGSFPNTRTIRRA
jgi:hypothetical protein